MLDQEINLPPWLMEFESDREFLILISKMKDPDFDSFKKLLADDPSLESMWRTIKKHSTTLKPINKFMFLIIISLNQKKFYRLTDKKLKKHGEKIAHLADQLALLLREIGVDTSLFRIMNHKTSTQMKNELLRHTNPEKLVNGLSMVMRDDYILEEYFGFIWASLWLKDLSEYIQKKISEERPAKVTNSKNADQTYFIRSLTYFMRHEYDRPLRRVVATAASVIFDNPLIDEAYVAKIAP